MIRRFDYTDVLGWSHSRYNTFRTCKRKYFYQYYAGFDKEHVIKINTLKNLTSIALEIGNITHQILQVLLKRIRKSEAEIDRQKFSGFSKRKAKEIFQSKIFQEIYYRDLDIIDFEEDILKRVNQGLANFLESDRLEWLFAEALTEKDDWMIEPEGFGECRIDNMKAYCKVDFLFPIGDEIHVIDWKTGKSDYSKHSEQLKGYVTWVAFHFGKKYDEIKPTVAYLLPEYRENSIEVNEFDIEDFSSQIRKQTNQMYQYCLDPDANTPLAKDRFPMTENEKICKYCNFRELCDRI